MEDDNGDNEDFAIDMESIIDSDADVVNSREANKDIGDTISALSSAVEKGVDDVDKGA